METKPQTQTHAKLKLAVIIFHKNVHNYPEGWIQKMVDSIKGQTYSDFDVFEMDYGMTERQIYPGSIFEARELETHADAHNFLLDKVFAHKNNYDYAFNVNVDDFYSLDRIEKQLAYAKQGYDVISSNFYVIDQKGDVKSKEVMSRFDIEVEAAKEHNALAHPVLCYSRNFWTTCTRLWSGQIPKDDFHLWKRSFGKYKFVIVPEFLLYYRVHEAKVSKEEVKKEDPVKQQTWQETNPAAKIEGDITKHPLYDPKADRIVKSSWDGVPVTKSNVQGTEVNAKPMTQEERDAHDKAREEWLKSNR